MKRESLWTKDIGKVPRGIIIFLIFRESKEGKKERNQANNNQRTHKQIILFNEVLF